MKLIVLFIVITQVFVYLQAKEPVLGYSCEANICFKLHKTPTIWTKAEEICMDEEAHLAIVRNQYDESNIRRLLSYVDYPYAWIGIHSRIKTGTYHTVQGDNITDLNWAVDEPNNEENERCVAIYPEGKLNNLECHKLAVFFCQKPNYVGKGEFIYEN